ncbi:hypothetical protein LX36DRAFT_664502 [Colletotrichum falcatum]|nr:hypothetical protein LX36DRAFT_664502 [Colletotrichum falcatum]
MPGKILSVSRGDCLPLSLSLSLPLSLSISLSQRNNPLMTSGPPSPPLSLTDKAIWKVSRPASFWQNANFLGRG